jgi:transposase
VYGFGEDVLRVGVIAARELPRDQNDVARAFGRSVRSVRRYQRRFEDGGLVSA